MSILQFVICAPQGAGKTTYAKRLAEILDCDFINDDGKCTDLCTKPLGPSMQRVLILTSVMESGPTSGSLVFKVADRQGLHDLIVNLSFGVAESIAQAD